MKQILFLLFASAFFGPYLILFNDKIQLIRILPLISIALVLSIVRVKLNRVQVALILYFTFYFVYTLIISLINLSILNPNDIINLTVLYFFVISVILVGSTVKHSFAEVFKLSVLFFLMTSTVVWAFELYTHKHLRYSIASEFKVDYYFQPTTTFFTNPNDFAVVFIFSSMYLLSLSRREDKFSFYNLFLVGMSLAVLYTTEARLCMVIFLIYAAFFYQFWRIKIFVWIIGLIVLSLYLISSNEIDLTRLLSFSFEEGGSLDSRLNLYTSGLQSILHSYGLGFGVGGYRYYYEHYAMLHLVDPHNFLIELLVSSGVLVTIAYIVLNVYIYTKLVNERTRQLLVLQFLSYNALLLASSSSLFLWPHYLFFIAYAVYNKESSKV